jgi:beta-N-acetylhexosaminidase
MFRPLLLLVTTACVAAGCATVSAGTPHNPTHGTSSTSGSRTVQPPQASRQAGTAGASATARTSAVSSTPPAQSASTTVSSQDPTTTSYQAATPQQLLASMSEAQRVGQLLMVDCPSTGVASATATAIRHYHVGSVILDGTTTQGATATRAVTSKLQSLAPSAVKLLISTDQEGGYVQRLQGSGFSAIPSALTQGQWSTSTLQSAATRWAQQLHHAGVNVNLAPVLDTVPPGDTNNPPIGDLDREYGHGITRVRTRGIAFYKGMAAGGVDATAKHFPGLGRVTGNTDTTSGVRDTITGPQDPYLEPFQAAVQAKVPLVMMSTAIYTKIDAKHPAAFSHAIVTGILRQRFGFSGVVISDDLGNAKQVSGYSVGARAVDFIRAGGDMVLTVNANQAATMTGALLHEASASSYFRDLINASALRVLAAKSRLGLLH